MKELKKIPHSWWVKTQQRSISGTPDIIGCVNGHFVALELKADQNAKISKLQLFELAQITNNGKGKGWIVYPDNMDLILTKIDLLLEN